MKDVAAALGCSVATVSLALRNDFRISEAMRARVTLQARKMGYKPNPLVSSLIAYRRKPGHSEAGTIAVLTKFGVLQNRWKFDDYFYFYSKLWNGLVERSAELGFRVEEVPLAGTENEGNKLTRIFRTRGIKGIILFPGGPLHQPYPAMDWRHFSIVAAAFHSEELPVHRVASDHAQAMKTAIQHVVARGYQRPGLALTPFLDPGIRFAMSGRFLAWQQSIAPDLRVPLIESKAPELDRKAFELWVRRHQPDVILSLTDEHYGWLRAMKSQKASRIDFVHLAKKENSPLAGVNLRSHEVGRSVINTLARELYLNHSDIPKVPELILVSGEWQDGHSVRRKIATDR